MRHVEFLHLQNAMRILAALICLMVLVWISEQTNPPTADPWWWVGV